MHVFLKLTADQVLVFHWFAGSNQFIILGEEGVHAKWQILAQISPKTNEEGVFQH